MMRWGKFVLALGVVAIAAHFASPYATTWRMWRAARAADGDTLAALIDWDQVRSGLKQDIADGIVGLPAQQLVAENKLAPFGSSFMAGVAGSFVDRDVTPQHLALALRELRLDAQALDQGSIAHAYFTGPGRFELALRAPGQDDDAPPLRLELEWRYFGWQIVRAFVPQDLLEQAGDD